MSATAPLLLLADVDIDGHMDWDGGWWIVMALGMIAFWGLLIFGIFWLVREVGSHRPHHVNLAASDPLAILDRRLAEGSVSPEEYRERREILSAGPTSPDAD